MLKHSLECLLLWNGNGDKKTLRAKMLGLQSCTKVDSSYYYRNYALNSKILWSTTALGNPLSWCVPVAYGCTKLEVIRSYTGETQKV